MEDDYPNNHNGMGDITDVDLRTKAEGKFNTLRTLQTWGSKSPADQKIIATSSEISTLKGRLALSSKGTQKPTFTKKGAAGSGGKLKNKKSGFSKSQQKEDEKWKKVPHKDGEPSTKTVKRKSWTWCVPHMGWGNQSSDECRLGKTCREEKIVANSADTSNTGAISASSVISQGLSKMAAITSIAARDE